MTRLRARTLLLPALLLCGVIGLPLEAQDQAGGKPSPVSSADLQAGTPIIGLLGRPLGELVSIRGSFVPSESLENPIELEIVEVSGAKVQRPIRMPFSIWRWGNLDSASLPENTILPLRVYETGGMRGVPGAALEETVQVETSHFAFVASIVVLYREDRAPVSDYR